MYLDVNSKNLQGRDFAAHINSIPDVCPVCHRNVHPTFVVATYLEERERLQAIFRCTRQECQELFVCTYRDIHMNQGGRITFEFFRIAPISPKEEDFPGTVVDISPTFVEIYNQTLAAESAKLSQLVGIGLRKGLEFLIKDYAAGEHPNEGDSIRASTLGQCINIYVSDTNIKECAKRAAWLGNDETHYVRKWEEKDIKDLKLLVRLTVNWIDNVKLTQKYIEEMNDIST